MEIRTLKVFFIVSILKKMSVYLHQSTSQLGFINPLHVEVASIGTVPNSFVLFLFYLKFAGFCQIKSVRRCVNPTFSVLFVNIINAFKLTFQRGEVAAFACRKQVGRKNDNHFSFPSSFKNDYNNDISNLNNF